VAARLDIPGEAVRVWVRRYKSSRSRLSEVGRLNAEMREMAMERNVLMKLATRLIAGAG
jgi:hypothetical protein